MLRSYYLINKILFSLILILAMSICTQALAANWHVDKDASGSNDGTGWTDAWESFADIRWGIGGVTAGDTLYISGGPISKTYNETLTIGASGSGGSILTVRVGQDANHNGTVIITNTAGTGIYLAHKNYVTINGNYNNECRIRVTGCSTDGVRLWGNSNNVILTYIEVDFNGDAKDEDGIDISVSSTTKPAYEVSYCKIHDNYQDQIHGTRQVTNSDYGYVLIHHNEIYNCNDDGIETACEGMDIYNNTMHTLVSNGGVGHPDGIVVMYSYARIWNNTVYNFGDPKGVKISNAYIYPNMYLSAGSESRGHIRIYNNLMYSTLDAYFQQWPRAIEFSAQKAAGATMTAVEDVVIANNTIIGMFFAGISAFFSATSGDNISDFIIENNIISNCGRKGTYYAAVLIGTAGNPFTMGSHGDGKNITYDYNLLYEGDNGNTNHKYKNVWYTYSNFKNLETGGSGIKSQDNDAGSPTNSSLGSDYKPDSVSDPVVDVGVDLSAIFTTAKDGNYRPQLTAWDIGAYEFGSSSVPPPIRSGGSPTGTLPSGTTSTTLSLITNENATCRYSTTAGISYSSMTNTFSTTGGTSHSTTVSGLADGNSYNYCVRCQNDSGDVNTTDYGISFSVDVPDSEPPTIPSGLQASPVSSSQINLTWTASTDNVGVTGYTIYRDGVQLDTSPTNSYPDTGLSPSSSYTYTVSAYDAEGNESNQSSPASATTPAAAPAFIEAQSGTITSPMQIVSDVEASGGAYIQTIQTDSGTAAYAFNIDESGIYKIIARVYASDGAHDSFYVKINDGEEFIWHLNPSGNPDEFNVWREDEVNNQGTGTWDNPQYDPYNIELTQGTHTITFRGRETNCRLDYFYFSKVEERSYPDAIAPTVTITQPTSEGSYSTSQSTLTVGGSTSDNIGVTSVTWINSRGGSGTASGTDNWTISNVSLQEGDNVITVTAHDAAGNSGVDTLTVTYTLPDTTDPIITTTSPTSGDTYSTEEDSVSIGGSASDNIGLTSVTWINSRGGNGTASGTDNWTISNVSLQEGDNVITVTAHDAAGNSGVNTLTVTYTLPDTTDPIITTTSPTSGDTYSTEEDSVSIGGSASDNIGLTSVTWINSRGGNGTASGTDNWTISNVSLQEGDNVITVTAHDAAGNSGVNTLTVTYTPPDTAEPIITTTSPTSGDTYSTEEDSVSLGGSASDNIGVTSVTWINSRGGSGTASGTDNWTISNVSLQEGDNVITVTAHDAAGNSGVDTLTVTYTPPDTADHIIEAQSGTISSPMQIVSDSDASGGAYIQTTQVDSGTAAYTFNIDESGTYKIIAKVYALDAAHDSFYVKIDDGEEFIWHLNPSDNPDEFNVWREDEVNNKGTGTWDNPQYDPYTIELTQGTHTITFRGRETNCRLDYFYFSKVEELSYNWFQAESENLSSPLETALDPDASAGAYIWKPSGSGDSATPDGAAEYTIDIPTTGDYVIWGRTIAPDGGSDSFFTSIDGGEHVAWHIPIGSVWIWVSVNGNEQDPLILNLAAGTHTLRISGREDGTKLDRLLITNDMDFVPSEENPDNVPPADVRNLRIE
jgi:Fibronectin type III domain